MKCEAAGEKVRWKCERDAVTQHDEKNYCMLHLPREHDHKTADNFYKALTSDSKKVSRLEDGKPKERRDLDGIVWPAEYPRGRHHHPNEADYAEKRLPILNNASLREANMSGANMWGAYLIEADLTAANMTEAELSSAMLNRANLFEANMSGARLWDVCLEGANLKHAVLSGAILRRATMTDVCITNATIDQTDLGRAKWPITLRAFDANQNPDTKQLAEDLLRLRNNLREYGRQDEADEIYLRERRARRKLLNNGPRKWLSYLFDWVAEYGNKPGRVLSVILGVFVFFGLLHMLLSLCGVPLLFRDVVESGKTIHESIHPLESFYFSIVAFTTLGFGDIAPLPGLGQILAGIEVTMGAPLMALFVFCLGRKSLR